MQDFGPVTTGGMSGVQTFTVTNIGGQSTGMLGGSLSGTDAAAFSITANGCAGNTLAPSGTCQVSVRFEPTTAGAKSATLTATASPGGMSSAALSGTGLSPGSITINPTSKNFGSIEEGQTGQTQVFTVQNVGGSATGALTTLVSGANAGEFTVALDGCNGQTLMANATCDVSVQFKPTTAGSKIGTLTVTGSPGGAAAAPLSGTALASAALAMAPASQDFSSVVIGQATTATFTITNTGGVPSGVPTAMLSGPDLAQYSINMNGCTAAIAGGGQCQVVVRFAPTSAGVKSVSLTVGASPGGAANSTITGTGITAGALSIGPANQNYGPLLVGSSTAPVDFTVTNTGGSATGTLTTSLAPAGDFIVVSDTCNNMALAASGTCLIRVRFAPATSGPKSATLQVSATPGGTAPASLSGTGLAPAQLSMAPPSFTFPNTVIGGTSTAQPFTVTNTGGVAAGTTTALATMLGAPNSGDFVIGTNTCTGTLGPGLNCSISVSFKPIAAGGRSASLNVSATPGGSSASSLSGTGETPANLTLAAVPPNSTSFGGVTVGSSATMTYLVSNTGQQTTSAVSVTFSGTDFSVLTGSAGDCNSGATTLAGGGTCNVRVRFAPTSNVMRSATLSVSAVTGGNPPALTLTGTGLNPGALVGSPGSNNFMGVEVGVTSSAINWTITNTGNLPTTGMAFSNTNGLEFPATNNCGATLAAMSNCTVSVAFKPSAGGARSGTLQMAYNEGPAITMSLSGTGMFRLTVSTSGVGTVTSNVGPIACGANCTALYPTGTVVTLGARTTNGSNSFFSGWSGDCAATGSFRDCTVTMTQNRAAGATFLTQTFNPIFVSSRTYNGGNSIGSVANADAECNTMATAAGLNNAAGTGFSAFISSAASNAFARLGANTRGWVRMDGKPVFDSQAEVQAGQIWHPINRDETGQLVTTNIYVATGTNPNGTTASNTCMDWTAGAGQFGAFGNLNNGPGGWIQENNFGCGFVLRLYCLGRTKTNILNPAAFGGTAKYMFVTAGTVAPNAVAGPAELDALCNTEKPAGSGTFKAWVATTGVAATSMLVPATNYQTIEKLLIGTGAQIAANAQHSNGAGMWEHSDFTFNPSFPRVYTGSSAPGNPGVDTLNCTNWGSTAGSGVYGLYTIPDSRWWNFNSQACTLAAHVHCMEQ